MSISHYILELELGNHVIYICGSHIIYICTSHYANSVSVQFYKNCAKSVATCNLRPAAYFFLLPVRSSTETSQLVTCWSEKMKHVK